MNNGKYKRCHRKYDLKKRYGITVAYYDNLLRKQKYKCAICKTYTPEGSGSFHIDHCHNKKLIRGLLCHRCNTGLGLLRDSPKVLMRSLKYIIFFNIKIFFRYLFKNS